ncbi:MAG: sulfite exporter TauE/SafE family protein [Actinobacteria bacterium HGW-Actinobacteria-7]|jgi:uncharacterized membrane protein YfcA|nr:MAG: sulfite exporter TauE/SafE family protein [Actinobacteria bacterium HGW-Actinobacteria-7]
MTGEVEVEVIRIRPGWMLEHSNLLVFAVVPLFWGALITTQAQPASYWLEYWWMFPIALVFATTANTTGISGAALFVPFFLLVFPLIAGHALPPQQSVLLGLVTEAFGLSSSGLAFFRFGLVDKKMAALTALGATPFIIAGAALSFVLPKYAFYFLVGLALAGAAYLMFSKLRRDSKLECIEKKIIDHQDPQHEQNVDLFTRDGQEYLYCRHGWGTRFAGYGFGGLFQGIGGFGLGELGIVSMLRTDIPLRVAIGTTHAVVAFGAIVAASSHLIGIGLAGETPPWNIAFMTVPAVILGGQLAPYVAARFKPETLELIVASLFVLLAVVLGFLGVRGVLVP